MNNKEAIHNLENWKLFDKKIVEIDGDLGESIRLAIKALEREENLEQALSITEDNSAVGDLISRSELKNRKFLTPDAVEAKKWLPEYTKGYQQGWNEAIDAIVDKAPTVEPDVNCSHCDYFKFSQLFVDNIAKLMADYNIETYDDLMNEINRVKDELNELGGTHG